MPVPGQFLPRNSGPHRIACKALYRSLLEQCTRINVPADIPSRGPVNPLKHLIRKKFKQNVQHASPRLIVSALKAGYAAEELLHAASTGNTAALAQIHSLLQTLHAQTLSARTACTQPSPRSLAQEKARLRAYPGAPKAADIRPLPLKELSNIRRVPKLAMATYLPFLRFKKPQSPYLSRVLTDKVKEKQHRTDQVDKLELDIELAETEDLWEDIVLREVQREHGNMEVLELVRRGWDEGGEWSHEGEKARWGVSEATTREYVKAGKLGERLIKIVEREKLLRDRERRERRHKKKEGKKEEKMRRLKELVSERVQKENLGKSKV